MSQGAGRGSQGSGGSAGVGGGPSNKKWGDTTSKRGEQSRVFVGNTDPKVTTCDDLENKFSAYGKIQGIDINPSGFSFVQFATVQEAQKAVHGENGTTLRNRKIEVRMFDKSGPPRRKNPGRERSRSPVGRNHSGGPSNFGPPMFGPPGDSMHPSHGPPPPPVGNDIEIIAVNKEQWAYAEMVEQRFRRETPIKCIDLLFLHSPQHLTMTLNDLYERRTLYAIVVTPINEEHKSITLHVLHNQTEHRNIPIEAALTLINEDFRAFMVRRGMPVPAIPPNATFSENKFRSGNEMDSNMRSPMATNGSSSAMNSATYSTSVAAATSDEKRLPDDIAYLLRTTLAEGGVQFLSLPQIDSIIDYFSRERDRLTSQARQQQLRTQTDQNVSNYPSSSGYLHENSYSQQSQQQQQQPQRQEYSSVPLDHGMGSSGNSNVNANSSDSATSLLDNPQVKAALNSLLQYGAISNSNQTNQVSNLNSLASSLMSSYTNAAIENSGGGCSNQLSNSEAPSYLSTTSPLMTAGSQVNLLNQQQQNPMRRHPLFGTEIGSSGSNIPNAYSNLVGYPQPGQRY